MKGVIHTLEAVIAIAMLVAAVVGLFASASVAKSGTAMLVQSGYSALQYIESTGEFRPAAAARDTVAIDGLLQPLLANYEVEICDPACSGTLRNDVAALDYFVAGYGSFQPVHLRLYLW